MRKSFFFKIIILVLSFNIFITIKLKSEEDNTIKNKETFQGEIGQWKETSSLLEPVASHYSFSSLDRICIFTGQSMLSSRATLFSAEINNEGIGFWKKSHPLAHVLEQFSAIAHNGFLYIFSGKIIGLEKVSVIIFAINHDITLGKAMIRQLLPEPLSATSVAVNKGYIYISGGKKGKNIYSKVFFAKLSDSGVPEKWQEAIPLPIAVYDHVMFAYNDFIYISGGYHNAGSIYSAHINTDGTIDKWISMEDTPVSLEKHSCIVYKDYVFISGGIQDGRPSSGVYAGKFLENGLIIKWKKLNNLPQSVFSHSMTINKNFLVVSGGISGGRMQTKILIAPLF